MVGCLRRGKIGLERVLAAGFAKTQIDGAANSLQERQGFGSKLAALCYVLERTDVLVKVGTHLAVEVR